MKNRGPTFWRWSDAQLQTKTFEEELEDGTKIDVQARLSRTGGTQLFLAVYTEDGRIITEEIYDNLPGQTTLRAIVSGTQQARAVATGALEPLKTARQGSIK
ncbi:MAG: hypothetical protein ACRYF9_22100 [Janthinobacterium lividum]